VHTPYDGSSKLFAIGLKPLDVDEWIDADERLGADLAEKERLAATHWDEVFAAEACTEAAQAEVLALLAAHLPRRFPQLYRREEDAMLVAGRPVPLGATPALWTAARLVQEDLVIMRRGQSGWRLAAATLCFPSSWRLAEKFRRPIHELHAPVPGFGEGTRHAELIGRMFDNMRPDTPMLRWNWSVYGDAELFHPHNSPARRFGDGVRAEHVFLRVERQTLRRLPATGDVLFTVRVFVDPLERLERHSDAPRLASALIEQLNAFNTEQLDYKGMTLERDRLVARLREIVG
jgi:dimethylamine monooxygenase subunit A